MKILCVTQRFFPVVGGAEQIAEKLVDYLAKRHEVTVYTTNALELNSFWDEKAKTVISVPAKSYKIKRYEILTPSKVPKNFFKFPLSISSPGPFSPGLWDELLNLKEDFDLIIASSFPYDHIIPAFLASKKFQIPFILLPTIHLQYPEHYFTGTKLAILNESDAIVVFTNAEAQVLKSYNILQNRIHIIPNGIDTKTQLTKESNIQRELNIDEKSLIVLFVGMMSSAKGTISLIEALKTLWQKSKKIELILIGPSNSEFDKYFQNQDQKFLNHIHNLGIVSEEEKWKAFSSCDIFAMPSQSESFGLTYLEAWKFHKPVIGCKIPSTSEIIDDETNGFLIEFNDINHLASIIEKLEDSNLRINLGNNGYKKLLENYDLQIICKKFEELCLSIYKK